MEQIDNYNPFKILEIPVKQLLFKGTDFYIEIRDLGSKYESILCHKCISKMVLLDFYEKSAFLIDNLEKAICDDVNTAKIRKIMQLFSEAYLRGEISHKDYSLLYESEAGIWNGIPDDLELEEIRAALVWHMYFDGELSPENEQEVVFFEIRDTMGHFYAYIRNSKSCKFTQCDKLAHGGYHGTPKINRKRKDLLFDKFTTRIIQKYEQGRYKQEIKNYLYQTYSSTERYLETVRSSFDNFNELKEIPFPIEVERLKESVYQRFYLHDTVFYLDVYEEDDSYEAYIGNSISNYYSPILSYPKKMYDRESLLRNLVIDLGSFELKQKIRAYHLFCLGKWEEKEGKTISPHTQGKAIPTNIIIKDIEEYPYVQMFFKNTDYYLEAKSCGHRKNGLEYGLFLKHKHSHVMMNLFTRANVSSLMELIEQGKSEMDNSFGKELHKFRTTILSIDPFTFRHPSLNSDGTIKK